ncbi:MAG TPA: hypothetical protein VH855_05960 [Acetobacteraceae bacterium]|jgi:hypothetical protein
MVLICNVQAFLLGPIALADPPWGVGATVAAVLLLTARQELHQFAHRIELAEIVSRNRPAGGVKEYFQRSLRASLASCFAEGIG